ncbi:undecaprenyl-phosphate glucose phosphotransferase, partial [Burkholderia contaminans]|nr:undecaprenyl-phosphate glucose phosphotransferase [Burkholderia contaminans]
MNTAMQRKRATVGARFVCAIDTLLIVVIAVIVHQGSLFNLATLRIEWLLISVSALLAAFVLRLAGIGLDGRTRPATRHALRTLLLWFVVQGFVFLKMIAITDVTAPLLAWFFGWTFCAAIALVAFRLVLGVVCRRSLGVA